MKYSNKSDGDICPKSCPCCADELVVLKVWGEWNYYLCESCKAIYDYNRPYCINARNCILYQQDA